jgi:hypothetical protein
MAKLKYPSAVVLGVASSALANDDGRPEPTLLSD